MRTPKVQLPYRYIKGSAEYRKLKSRAISENIFYELLKLYKNKDDIAVSEIGRNYNKLMPAKIDLTVKKLSKAEEEICGAMMSNVIDKNGNTNSFRISIPAEENEFAIEDLPALIHETVHLFDGLCSPKTTKTISKIYAKNLENITNDFYNKYFYCGDSTQIKKVRLPKLKHLTKNFLKKNQKEDRILVLKYIKESLESERSAFKIQNDCDDYLEKIGRGDRPYTFEEINMAYHFDEKINMLKKMIFEEIFKERLKIAKKNAQTPMDKLKLMLEYCFKSIM